MQPQKSKRQTTRSTVQDVPSSSSIPSVQCQLSGGRSGFNVPADLTRANLDQWKRNLKFQLQQKIQKLNSLRTEVNNLLSGMQNVIDTVTANMQAYQGQPGQLARSLMQEFNVKSTAVQKLDTEIGNLVNQVQELRCQITAVTNRSKTDPGALKAGHSKPNVPCTMEDSKLPVKQPEVLGFPVSQNQFQRLSANEVQESEFSQEQPLEDPRKTRAQRLQTSSNVERQELLQGNDTVHYSSPFVENDTTFFNSLSVHSLLGSGTGAMNFDDDAMYDKHVNDVACMESENCNKRISSAGPERSAG